MRDEDGLFTASLGRAVPAETLAKTAVSSIFNEVTMQCGQEEVFW
jgi:hypothetical protein